MKKNLLQLAVLTLPLFGFSQTFQEDFDGNGPGIAAWTVLDVDGQTPNEAVAFISNGWNRIDRLGDDGNFGGPAGNYAAMSTSWYTPAGTSNDWLISPQISLATASVLKWDAKAQDAEYPDGYKVMLSTNGGNTVADFTVELFSTTGEDPEWVTREASLTSYTGQTVRIAFVNNSNDKFMLLVDNVKVDSAPTVAPSCTTVTSPANNTTGVPANATFSWTAAPGASSYDLYLDTNANPTTLLKNVTGNSYTVTSNLDLNTVYYWKLVPKNAAGAATGCAVNSFTTSANPPYCGPLTFVGLFGENIEPISLVNFAGINNVTDATLDNSPGHEFFLDQFANVNTATSYDITLKGNTGGNYTNNFAVFIDWNQNGTFESGETYLPPSIVNSTGTDAVQSVLSIAVPANATAGTTRLRVKKIYGVTDLSDACVGASFGQAEDYSVNVSILGVSETGKNTIKAYPNPVKDIFNIVAEGKIKSVKVYDVAGKQILTKEINDAKSQIDFSRYSAGIYIVTTVLEDGTSTSTKVIKK